MRRSLTILICIVVLCSAFTLPCLAAQSLSFSQHNMTLQLPDDFVLINEKNKNEYISFLEQHSPSVTPTDLSINEDYLFLGVSSTMQCTLFLSYTEDEVSATIGDLITYKNKETAKGLLLGTDIPDSVTVKEIEQRGALFYRVDFGVEQQIGRLAYCTVMNGGCYTLGLIDNSGTLSQNINSLLDTVFEQWDYTIDAEAQRIDAFKAKVMTVVYWVSLPLAIILIFFIVRSLVRELRNRQIEADRKKNIPKRPRR